ncbi:MAG: DUF493 domain-containing protein [Ectothiorhodospiraceae bacterium]|nr:DUF493 domain-containing protein [Ectothiorhodospiraceae bacterium]
MTEPRESAIEFPCEFPIKVMGHSRPDFVLRVVEIVRAHAPDLDEEQITTTPSRRGNYVSVTVTLTATSQHQLDQVYLALNADEQVVMTL